MRRIRQPARFFWIWCRRSRKGRIASHCNRFVSVSAEKERRTRMKTRRQDLGSRPRSSQRTCNDDRPDAIFRRDCGITEPGEANEDLRKQQTMDSRLPAALAARRTGRAIRARRGWNFRRRQFVRRGLPRCNSALLFNGDVVCILGGR